MCLSNEAKALNSNINQTILFFGFKNKLSLLFLNILLMRKYDFAAKYRKMSQQSCTKHNFTFITGVNFFALHNYCSRLKF